MYTIMLSPSGDTTGATDTAAIQTAINSVMTSTGNVSRCLLLEDGNYFISSKIVGTWGATSASWGPLEIKGSGGNRIWIAIAHRVLMETTLRM